MKKNRFICGLYQWAEAVNDRTLLKVFFQVAPVLWTTVIIQAFHSWCYNSETGNLNALGIGGAVSITLVSLVFLILSDILQKEERKKQQKKELDYDACETELEVRKAVTEAESALEEKRNRQIRLTVGKENPSQEIQKFITKTIYPIERINSVLDEIGGCFSTLSGLMKSDFMISGAVAIINTNKNIPIKNLPWTWVSAPKAEGTADLEDLLNGHSAFYTVASGNKTFYYANDKTIAAENNEYFMDGRDKTYGSGSIVCTEITEDIGKWRIRLIISISTYGKMIIGQDMIDAGADIERTYEGRIRDVIIKQFEGELKEDLLWYGIENIDFNKNKPQNVQPNKKGQVDQTASKENKQKK